MRSSKGESGTACGFSTAVFTGVPCDHKDVETSKPVSDFLPLNGGGESKKMQGVHVVARELQ